MSAAIQASSELEALPACAALGIARATFYRYRNLDWSQDRALERQPPARSLTTIERKTVLDLLISERFADDPPRQIWATLLDEGKYFCSVSTMYRILRAECGIRGTSRSIATSRLLETRAACHRPQPSLVVGHHETVGSCQVDLLGGAKGAVSLRQPVVVGGSFGASLVPALGGATVTNCSKPRQLGKYWTFALSPGDALVFGARQLCK